MSIPAKRRRSRRTGIGPDLIAGLREAVHAATTGDYSKLKVREIEISDPRQYTPSDVKALRTKLGVTQGMFARLMGVSPNLVAHWEYNIRKPAPLARRLMDKISEDPVRYLASLVRRRKVLDPPRKVRQAG